jgi:hypothetical protein
MSAGVCKEWINRPTRRHGLTPLESIIDVMLDLEASHL